MPLVVAQRMADGQIVGVAVAALAQWLNVFKRCGLWQHMLPAHPARYYTVQLTRHCFVNFAPDVGEFAHVLLVLCFVQASWWQAQWAAARIRRSRTPSQVASLGSVSTQINFTPCASKSRSAANSCCAVAAASSGMRLNTTRDD